LQNTNRCDIPLGVTSQTTIEDEFKLITDLSVPEYAFLLRTFVETGLYKNKDKDKPLTRLFALKTKTKGTASVSPENLRKLFYKDDYKVREAVKVVVIKMLNYIQNLNILFILLRTFQDYYLQVIDTTL